MEFRRVLFRSGEAAVGVYGVAYALASAVLLVLAGLNLVFFPTAIALWRQGPARLSAFIERSLRVITAALGVFVPAAFLLGGWTVRLLVGPPYAAAARVLPL